MRSLKSIKWESLSWRKLRLVKIHCGSKLERKAVWVNCILYGRGYTTDMTTSVLT